MDESRLRAWWFYRQGLDGSLQGKSASDVLERSDWARSVGGVGPYLTLFSRAGVGREEADKAVAKLEIHELPSARGCTYVACEGFRAGFESRRRIRGCTHENFRIKDKALEAVVAETETYIREQLGDARSFSLDTPKSRGTRIEALRKVAGK